MTEEYFERTVFGSRFEEVFGASADALTEKILEQHGVLDSDLMRSVVRSSVAQGMDFVDALYSDPRFGDDPPGFSNIRGQEGRDSDAGVVIDFSKSRDRRRFDQDKGPRR